MIDRRIKFRHIQCFVEIHRQQSMKRAAERLFITQSAISKTLKELEQIIEAVLLIRNRGGVTLTKEGEVFLHFAEVSLAALQQGMDGLDQFQRSGRARLSIGSLPSVAARLMPVVVRHFKELAPGTTLSITDGPHSVLVDQLRRGMLELVIGRLGPPDSMQGISFSQLYNERVAFVVRPAHPILDDPDLSRIGQWTVLYPPKTAAIRPLVERYLIENGVGDIPNKIETVSGAFGRSYTRRSDAIWIISEGVVVNEVTDGSLVSLPFDTGITQGPVGLMTRSDDSPGPQASVLRRAVRIAVASLGL